MSNEVIKSALNAVLPPGPLWQPQEGADLDLLMEGIADNAEIVRSFLEQLSKIRNPNLTPFLSDLEREYGILTDTRLTEEVRREQLSALVYARDGGGTADFLESTLQAAGFDVLVHQNDPAVDPAIFLDQSFQMIAAGVNAYAGRSDAFAGRLGGDLLVNGPILDFVPVYISVAGLIYAGQSQAFAGNFDESTISAFDYEIPTDPDTWPFIFFVGGPATRDPGTGALTAIQSADIPNERQSEFKRIILKIKPLFTWAGLIITYV